MSFSCELKPRGYKLRDSGGHHGEEAHLTTRLTQIKAELRENEGTRCGFYISEAIASIHF